MNTPSKDEILVQKVNKAKETLLAAKNLLEDGLPNSAVNRLYYSCFYAASALLFKKDILAKSHSGVQQMLGLHFVATGILEKELGEFYGDLFRNRQLSDYDDFVNLEKEYVKELYENTKQFLAASEKILSSI